MGWSCRADAARAYDRLSEACRPFEGSSNVFHVGLRRFFFEGDRVEHEDGRITGEWFELLADSWAQPMGTWTIVADGSRMIGGHLWMQHQVNPA